MIHRDFGPTTETVLVECTACSNSKKVPCSHAMSNEDIAARYFYRWAIKGVRGAPQTLCPTCKNRIRRGLAKPGLTAAR